MNKKGTQKRDKMKKSKKMTTQPTDWKQLLKRVSDLICSARETATRSIDTLQVFTNFKIGHLIVEHEQQGKTRAGYGEQIIKRLAKNLTKEFGKGFSSTNLKLMRQFYLLKAPQIGQTMSDQLLVSGKSQTVSGQLIKHNKIHILNGKSPFTLSWSHYVFLMGVNDEKERQFYEIEARSRQWSVRELKRQYNSSLYERLALSRDKKKIRELSKKGLIITRPADLMKEPLVLEFLGLDEKTSYAESDLESAIIDKLEHFLLELGKGFLFESRQKRFTYDGDHFYVDLVFYNRLLRCYVLVDLKIGKLTHKNLGQMQMYVNYFDRKVKKEDEHPTIGIVLCKSKSSTLVEMMLPKEVNIYASEYKLYLPSKTELKKKLMEWTNKKK